MTTLDIGCSRYEHVAGLFDGSISIEGADVRMHSADMPSDIFEKMIRDRAYDVAELGLTYHLRLLDTGNSPFVALPIFLARVFRHSAIYINTQSGIRRPEDLAGKTIGEFGMYGHDGGVWPKGILSDEFGLTPDQCRWVIGATDWYMPPFDFIAQPHPANVEVQPVPEGDTLSDMLERGEIQALMSARAPRCFVDGSPRVARLFPDHEAVERDYFARTGIFPIMHTLVVRRDLLEAEPDFARAIFEAFTRAKDAALDRLRVGMVEMNFKTTVPWLTPLLDRNRTGLGDDWWPYGVAANRTALDTFCRYFHEQGLSSRHIAVEELFAADLLDT
ncbi:ABC transporter substrate-binding protein [Paraburkholderia silvatlantica]|uniref:4,5-dihydroxyphthalate decarboxylase n=1 Tax=Paraburkholderia silvatlantica TaxID=321895 RepID=A0ABR6FGQ8_9BURK|nr:ABC transporter substrate-binding protein [Paraburkholderia silvatlantica]MBB2926598.1 4,5-dihydroxyphthalate decarboxylase [Paraburkholderia silvatlantica]PVY37764.1 4,5-dihydroxyphthalate decarboxylase [Paraburkholderia silvatlantica]PXW42728.1 4,5-dihydroxyphthalate decarboxylase [Paraburkholderia silvatlantica]